VERLLWQIRAGKVTASVGGAIVRSDGGRLWVLKERPYSLPLSVPGEVEVEPLEMTIASRIGDAATMNLADLQSEWEVAFDADRLHLGIEVRSWRDGDRLSPFGLDGHMKVGDVFTNAKIPRALRAVWPVAAQGDELLWVVGLRRSGVAPVTGETQRILSMSARGARPWSVC
jgi:tRNA(Ile)-lysidine synthase